MWVAWLQWVLDEKLGSLLSRRHIIEHRPKPLGVLFWGQVISTACRRWSRQHYVRLKLLRERVNGELAWIELLQWWCRLQCWHDSVIASWRVSHRFETATSYFRQARLWLRQWDDMALYLHLLERKSWLWIPLRPLVEFCEWFWCSITTEIAYVILEVTWRHALNSSAICLHHWLQYVYRLELPITPSRRCCLFSEDLHRRSALFRAS